jgi:AraC-like DNA-binding protein
MAQLDLRNELFGALAEPFSGEALFDCLADVVFFIKNRRAEYVVVNQTLVERCGLRLKGELVGRRADDVFPSPLGHSYRMQDEEVLLRGTSIRNHLELHFYPTGRRGWCLTNKLPLHGSEGSVVGLFGASKDLQAANERSEDFARVAGAVERIRTRFEEQLQVPDLAAGAGLSVYQFEQRIRRIFHVTVGQLLQKVRMEAAVTRLLETDEAIAVIALKCGYSDQSAFTRKFRETVGLSPLEYRRNFHRAKDVCDRE